MGFLERMRLKKGGRTKFTNHITKNPIRGIGLDYIFTYKHFILS